MLRLIATPFLNELWRHGIPMVSTAAKRQLTLLPFNHAYAPSPHHSGTIVRPITSGWSLSKDVPQPKTEQAEEKEKIDLDIWKSMMRSQVTTDEKHGDDEEGAEGGGMGPGGQDGNAKEASTQEATRELVVMWRQAGKRVPEHMTDEEVQHLSELTTKSSKKKYLKYLAIKEGHKNARKEKQEKKKTARASMWEQRTQSGGVTDDEAEEGGQKVKNALFLQFWSRSLDKLLGWRSAQAMIFGQPLVFDLSYEPNMSKREVENSVSQLMEVEAWNRRAVEPFHLHFCNLQPNGTYKRELLKRYGEEFWDRLLITSTDSRHVDVFPRERLVYLTADSPNVLHTFDHSKIYIVGGFVDRSIQPGVSLANAKRLKLATARLPLDEFLHWETGAKNLTLDQMICILLSVKETGKWEKALEFVPKRKHGGLHERQPKRWPSSQGRDGGSPVSRATSAFNSKGPDVDGGVTNYSIRNKRLAHKQGDDHERTFRMGDRNGDETFRDGNRRFSHSYQDSEFSGVNRERSRDRTAESRMTGLTGGRESKPAGSRLRTSLKSKMEENRTGTNKKPWWGDQ